MWGTRIGMYVGKSNWNVCREQQLVSMWGTANGMYVRSSNWDVCGEEELECM